MGYSSGLLKDRIDILNRTVAATSKFGLDASAIPWQNDGTVWASVDWARGKQAMNAGAVDIYGVVIVRMRWNDIVTMRSRIEYDSHVYQILGDTFHADRQANTIQFQAQLVVSE